MAFYYICDIMIMKEYQNKEEVPMALSLSFVVCDPVGLHARPATILVNKANHYESDMKIIYNGKEMNLKSIMGVMALGVPTQAEVIITADGNDEKEAIAQIRKAIKEQKVGEINE